jgi:GAF domain-containing protein
MAENLIIAEGGKEQKYELLYKQIEALVQGESDPIANMANMAAMIHHTFGFWWTGFYRVAGDELVLGPFQGPLACSRIGYGRGVCGTAWKEQRTQVVPDVEQFPGHIACSSLSRSEIVVPVWKEDKIIAVLDIDSEHLATFDTTDQKWLEKIVDLL